MFPCWFRVRPGPSVLILVCLLLSLVPGGRLGAEDLPGFVRGDCTGEGLFNISDPILQIAYIFEGDPIPPCLDACDADDSGSLSLVDVILTLDRIFVGPLVFPEPVQCGFDPTADPLDCDTGPCSQGILVEERSVVLETGRVGVDYVGDLPAGAVPELFWQDGGPPNIYQFPVPYVEYGFALDSHLPVGLILDPATGEISGTPVGTGSPQRIKLWARLAGGSLVLYHADLVIFSAAESEFAPASDLENIGPFLFTILDVSFEFDHDLAFPPLYPLFNCLDPQPSPDLVTETKDVSIFNPVGSTTRRPILFFHHGAGFGGLEYGNLLAHLATYGIIGVTVNDQFPYGDYVDHYCWGGHEEAAHVLMATRNHIQLLDETPGHPLEGRIDWTRVFYGGHSRGAGTAMIAAEYDGNTRGVLLLQGTDARQDSWIGFTNRWIHLPDVPVLNISAEQDTDVIYPFAERLLERFTGPATMVTVYGGCHGFATDSSLIGCNSCTWSEVGPFVDTCSYIQRGLQHEITRFFAAAFFQRHAYSNISLENLLYGNEREGSAYHSLAYRRNLGSRILVDDFSTYPTNALGQSISSTGMLFIDADSCYDDPFPLPPAITPIDNLLMILPPLGEASLQIPLGTPVTPLDVTSRKRLTFRIKNHDVHGNLDNFGFAWVDITLTVTDADGDQALVSINDHLPSAEFHPEPEPAGLQVRAKYQRFLTVTIALEDLVSENPALDLDRLLSLDWDWVTDGTEPQQPRIGLDDLQFE